MTSDQSDRLESMTDPNAGTWDLSDKDRAAIRAALDKVAALRAEITHIRDTAGAALKSSNDQRDAALDEAKALRDQLDEGIDAAIVELGAALERVRIDAFAAAGCEMVRLPELPPGPAGIMAMLFLGMLNAHGDKAPNSIEQRLVVRPKDGSSETVIFVTVQRATGLTSAQQRDAAIAEANALRAQVRDLTAQLDGTASWVGPCVHGRDPWDRCETCGEGNAVEALVRVVEVASARALATEERAEKAEARVAALESAARRVIKYAGEDGAVTPGSTRLDRMLVKLGDLLADAKEPTPDPRDERIKALPWVVRNMDTGEVVVRSREAGLAREAYRALVNADLFEVVNEVGAKEPVDE